MMFPKEAMVGQRYQHKRTKNAYTVVKVYDHLMDLVRDDGQKHFRIEARFFHDVRNNYDYFPQEMVNE